MVVNFISLVCKCGNKVGDFAAGDDHTGVYVLCQKCKAPVLVSNGLLADVDSNPDYYDCTITSTNVTECEAGLEPSK